MNAFFCASFMEVFKYSRNKKRDISFCCKMFVFICEIQIDFFLIGKGYVFFSVGFGKVF